MSGQTGKMFVAQFFAEERERLVSYVRRLIDDAAERDGEDIVQDVALSLLNRADFLMPIESLSAYVHQSVRHRVIDYLRRRKDILSLDEEGSSEAYRLSDVMADVEKEAARSDLRTKIFEAIGRLPDEQKAVFIETELNGRSFRDLSKEWRTPVGTLLARKSRAMAKIRESLRETVE